MKFLSLSVIFCCKRYNEKMPETVLSALSDFNWLFMERDVPGSSKK